MIRSRHGSRAVWLLVIASCRADAPVSTPKDVVPAAASIAVIAGDRQSAEPQDALTNAVRFQVSDIDHRPVPGVTVFFDVPIGGGTVPHASGITDSTGIVETRWTMGSGTGVQTLEARTDAQLTASASATTCEPEECYPPATLASTLSDATLLRLATYEPSGETVHPDVAHGHGYASGYWMAITPYPQGNSSYENPSLFHSRTTANWLPAAGAPSPLVTPPLGGYLSDPDIVVDVDQRLWVFYRTVINQQNIIDVIRSSDGIHWDSAVPVVVVPSHSLVSPAVVRAAPHAPWQMWSINSGTIGCNAPTTTVERRTSLDGLVWSAPVPVSLTQPGQAIWHIDVQWIPARSEYWALYNTYPIGTSCTTNALYFARSADGIQWTASPSPIARAGVIAAFQSVVYRSTFMTDPKATRITLWISGAAYTPAAGYNWQTATVSTSVTDFLAIASTPSSSLIAPPFRHDLPPPEPDVGPAHQPLRGKP